METSYEWSLETLDQYADVVDLDFSESLADLMHGRALMEGQRLCLLKRRGNDAKGERDRGYAYVEDGVLDGEFDNGMGKVPARFHAELAKWLEPRP